MNQLTKIQFSRQGLKIVGKFAKPKNCNQIDMIKWTVDFAYLSHLHNNFSCRCNIKHALILWFYKSTTFSYNIVLTDTKYSCYIGFYVVVHESRIH